MELILRPVCAWSPKRFHLPTDDDDEGRNTLLRFILASTVPSISISLVNILNVFVGEKSKRKVGRQCVVVGVLRVMFSMCKYRL